MRQLILVAAHDDGSGAHVTLFHLCRALLERFRTHDNPPLLVYLNSSNFQKKWTNRHGQSPQQSRRSCCTPCNGKEPA